MLDSVIVLAETLPFKVDMMNRGGDLLGYLKGLAIVVAILGVFIIAGKMVAGHLRGSGNQAAEAVGELPWVLLAIVLVAASSAIVIQLLGPAYHPGGDDNPISDFQSGIPCPEAGEDDENKEAHEACEG